jgi:hypothetical protein
MHRSWTFFSLTMVVESGKSEKEKRIKQKWYWVWEDNRRVEVSWDMWECKGYREINPESKVGDVRCFYFI